MRLRRALWMAIVVGCGSLTGCASLFEQSSSTGAAILGSAAASTVTRNAAVATGIGLGVEALAAQGVRIVERRIHADEQAAIASVAGPLPTDSVATWEVHHSFALEPDEKGHVSVTRITTALGRTCKEIIFTVEVGDQQAPGAFLAEVCSVSTDESGRWTWALAEPSTDRWGVLQ